MATLALCETSLLPHPVVGPTKDLAAIDAEWQKQLADKVIQGLCARPVSVGRSSACLVHIGGHAATISRKHADIVHVANGRCELRVLGMNGVRVNGTLYLKGAVVALSNDDELNFVGIRFRFCSPTASALAASNDGDAEDWWPEPSSKRALDTSNHTLRAQHKRARLLANESESFFGSADTLVNSSEPGLFSAGDKQSLMTRQLLDDLPPSSPPPIHFCSEPEEEYSDDLPDSIDVVSVTPALSQVATPLPHTLQSTVSATSALSQPTTPRPHTLQNTVVLAQVKADPTPVKAITTESVATSPAKKSKAVKENTSPEHTAKLGKHSATLAKQRKKSSAGGEQSKTKTPKTKSKPKSDDDMMASLRELLGIVDQSEGLADSIDSETEEFLTVRPEQPISLPSKAKLLDVVIETMVFSARTSHTVSDLLRDIAHVDSEDTDARAWRHHLTWTLFHNKCFGRVERRVKDASDRRAEDRWYYDAAKDECVERRENFGGLVRTARRCTLRDTQYFFKQVPKLPSFRYR
ncbi:hypothetical protein EV180_003565 [Coemansia sp. RSA 518]|nr:hypothetical protein IW142_005321 [Coemansia sp. RSA 564]KAJ2224781.1 hypothetical protein EV180_003565 [Coemansia sp. RSA 518]KAJ2403808.1 hypothetical protein J3F80_005289 [Coemansia sp. RSA 2526]